MHRRPLVILIILFSLLAYLTRAAGLVVPLLPNIVSDPREIFVVIGAALTGPVGGVVIGASASVYNIFSEPLTKFIMLPHMMGGAAVGLGYRHLIYPTEKALLMLTAWGLMVALYYFVFLFGGTLLLVYLFEPALIPATFGEPLPIWQGYRLFVQTAWGEVLFTIVVTTALVAIAPHEYRQPRWEHA